MLSFIFVLSVLVLFHELGHYLAARWFGVTVESFSIGFGPRLLGFRRNGTDFKVCLLPLGGYVKMAGMSVTGTPTGEPGELASKPRWQRLVVIGMGPVFNFLLALVLLAGLYSVHFERAVFLDEAPRIDYVSEGSAAHSAGLRAGDLVLALDGVPVATWADLAMESTLVAGRPAAIEYRRSGDTRRGTIEILADAVTGGPEDPGWSARHRVRLNGIMAGSPAAEAGLQEGDELLRIDGQPVLAVDQVPQSVEDAQGGPLVLELLREGRPVRAEVRAARSEEDGPWRIGVRLSGRFDQVDQPLDLGQAVRRSVADNLDYAGLIFRTLRSLMVGDVSLSSLQGPVGIYDHTQDVAAYGFGALIQLMALISINLGIVNLVPIPVLDGGHILLLLVEGLLRRELSLELKARVTQAGLVFIVVLFGIVMYNDLMRKFYLP